MISQEHPFLEASPDTVVHDRGSDNPFGLAEIKIRSPYSERHMTPFEAADFCSTLEMDSDGQECLKLKHIHTTLRCKDRWLSQK